MRNSGLCTFAIAAALMSAFATGFSLGADLPDGPGKVETTRVCGKCHLLDQATSLRQGQAAWSQTISKMVELGAEGTEAEFTAILNYLVKNFDSGNSTSQPPSPSPTATVELHAQPTTDASVPKPERQVPQGRKTAAVYDSGPPIPAANQWPTYGHDSGGQR
jgi:quinoprotein glucose dehydrogenase